MRAFKECILLSVMLDDESKNMKEPSKYNQRIRRQRIMKRFYGSNETLIIKRTIIFYLFVIYKLLSFHHNLYKVTLKIFTSAANRNKIFIVINRYYSIYTSSHKIK